MDIIKEYRELLNEFTKKISKIDKKHGTFAEIEFDNSSYHYSTGEPIRKIELKVVLVE